MDENRAKILSEFLTSDVERAKKLSSMEPADALKKINAEGYDFTLDELLKFGEEVRKLADNVDLNENDLEKVAGGFAISGTVIAGTFVGTVLFAVGQRIGKYMPW